MDKLRAMQLLVKLADLGSFTRVAEQTYSSKSMISKEISRLEADIGVRLLHRTTRNVKLTPQGHEYLHRVRDILTRIEDADNLAQELTGSLRGKLKINMPMALGVTELSNAFADFMVENPEIELDVHLGDEVIDLVEQGFDLGFRASSTPLDSNYVGRPLTAFNYRICVSPSYLASQPPIKNVQDLAHHNCFIYRYFQGKNIWPVDGEVQVQGSLVANNTLFMMTAIKRGLGVGYLPDFVCKSAIEAGELVEVLPNTNKPQLTLYALYPARHYVPAKLTQCITFIESWFLKQK